MTSNVNENTQLPFQFVFSEKSQIKSDCFLFLSFFFWLKKKTKKVFHVSPLFLSQAEALAEEKHQPRQVQAPNPPALPEHALRGPAGAASAPATSAAHGPVAVLPGGHVAARSSTAASAAAPPLPALTQRVALVSLVHTPLRVRSLNATTLPLKKKKKSTNSSFHHYRLWKTSFLHSRPTQRKRKNGFENRKKSRKGERSEVGGLGYAKSTLGVNCF